MGENAKKEIVRLSVVIKADLPEVQDECQKSSDRRIGSKSVLTVFQ